MRLFCLSLTCAAILYSINAARAGTPADSNIKETTIASGLSGATAMAWAPDGSNRLFVTRKGGDIRIVKNGSLLSTPFATLSPIYTSSECGLLSICFDPNFAVNGYVYVFVTVSSSEQQIIRYQASGDLGGNKTVLVKGLPTRGANHDGGDISIGPDGKLYWAIGDLGSSVGVDSDTSSLASKVGRANLDGTPVNDNPYYSTSDGIGPRDYIWARGFRNPFKHAWHKPTGKMWLNVVGASYEQVFAITKGSHGGWDNYEGGNQPSGYVKPVIQYVTNGSVGGCITGGTFYNGTAYPSQYRGNYFYGDYNSQKILRAVVDSYGNVSSANTTFVSSAGRVIDVCEGPDGALYYVDYAGYVRRLAYASTSQELIVSTTSLTVSEGSKNSFSVRLAVAPSSTVYVNVARSSGDSDVTVSSGSTLSFTSSNYSTPQSVTLSAAEDSDTSNDSASVSVASSGLSTKSVAVAVSDNDTQSFVLSSSSLSLKEGGSGSFTVHLANQPSSTVYVTVSRTSGDSDVNVTSGGSLTFSSSNYATPQTVSLAAAHDSDNSNDSASISVAASGISTRTVSVGVTDDDGASPIITTKPVTTAVVGALYTYDVDATGTPAPYYWLYSAPSGMTIDSATGLISWKPSSSGSFGVKVVASNGISPSHSQSYTITVGSDGAPTAIITRPLDGETVSGAGTEWYGDGKDDAGTVKAEFYIDGVLKYTDSNTSGHYHFGGTHNAWDTTGLSNGSHVLKMVVYDAKGQTGSHSVTVTVSNNTDTSSSVPSGLVGTAGADSATLKWNSFSGASAYYVKRSKTDGGPHSTIAKVTSPGHTDDGLVVGRTYYYVVSAITSSGETGNSSQIAVTPGSSSDSDTTTTSPDTSTSTAPVGLTATSGATSASLTWTAYSGAGKYYVKRSKTDGGPHSTIATVTVPGHVDDGLVAGRTYYYVVSAVTSSGETPNSGQVYAIPGTTTISTSSTSTTSPTTSTADAPSDLKAAAGDSEISLTWSGVSGASGYHVKRSKTDGGPHSEIAFVTGTSHTDDGLVNGRTYYYVVSAELSTGEGPNSAQAAATPTDSITAAAVTDPNHKAGNRKVLPNISVNRNPNGNVDLVLSGVPGTYAIERSSDLAAWEVLTVVELEHGTAAVSDTNAPASQQFYRVVRLP